MKILFAINTMNVGGAETGLVELANTLVNRGHQVDILLTLKTGPLLDKLDKKINVISVVNKKEKLKSLRGIFAVLFSLVGVSKFTLALIDKDYDIVIPYLEGIPTILLSSYKGKKISSVRVELLNHKTILDYFPWGKLLQVAKYNQYDYIHFVSTATQESFFKRFPTVTTKSITITTGFDIEKIQEKSKEFIPKYDEDYLNIVLVGRIEEQKGFDKLFKLASETQFINPGIKFHIIGNNDTKHYQKLLKKYGEPESLEVYGQKENPYPYILNADYILSTSNYEGFPRVLNESLALQKRVIATNIKPNINLLEHGKYGIIYENNYNGLVNAIKKIHDSKKVEDDSRKSVKTLDLFASEFLELIDRVTEEKI